MAHSMAPSHLKWLNWATIDLEKGLGGVEVHARSLAHSLEKLGVDCSYSNRMEDLQNLGNSPWDVIHTRGSFLPTALGIRELISKKFQSKKRPLWIHSLHGETLGRMWACKEWKWVGGYLAAAREYAAVAQADLILGDHQNLLLYQLSEKFNKPCHPTWHGWDAFDQAENSQNIYEPLSEPLQGKLNSQKPFWIFLGRGSDPVKGADLLIQASQQLKKIHLVATPGAGFEKADQILKTGALTSAQVRTVLSQAQGLVLPSRYEGFGIVVLEALAQGILVVATPVHGLKSLPSNLMGLTFAKGHSSNDIAAALEHASMSESSESARLLRQKHNREILPNWDQVAKKVYEFVLPFLRDPRQGSPKNATASNLE